MDVDERARTERSESEASGKDRTGRGGKYRERRGNGMTEERDERSEWANGVDIGRMTRMWMDK